MEYPLYITVAQASEMSGIGRDAIYNMLNSTDPPPFIRIGNKRLIQRDAFPTYLESKQEVKP